MSFVPPPIKVKIIPSRTPWIIYGLISIRELSKLGDYSQSGNNSTGRSEELLDASTENIKFEVLLMVVNKTINHQKNNTETTCINTSAIVCTVHCIQFNSVQQ